MNDEIILTKTDIDREVDLTHQVLRRHGIPANYGDATYLVARAHDRRSMDDLVSRMSAGKPVQPWSAAYVHQLVDREFDFPEHVLREAIDELRAAIHPADSTVFGLRSRIASDPAIADIRISDLALTGQLRRKLPLLEAQRITTLGVFADQAHAIAPVWTTAVLKALAASPAPDMSGDRRNDNPDR